MTEQARETGIVKSVSRCTDEDGREVLRAIVDFHAGNCPALTFGTVWNRVQVKIVLEPSAIGEEACAKEG